MSFVDENLVYNVHNNKSFPFEKRILEIDLKKGSPQDSVATGRSLGSFNINLNNIEENCLADGKSSEFTEPLSNNSLQELSGGHVTIDASKKIADKEYIMLKKKEVVYKLKLQLEYIERFNQDPKTPPGASLTANILGVGGKSILHAAIVLVDDKGLVEKMLRLGANPRSSTSTGIGTPLNLAQRNFHSALDKEKNVRLRGLDTEPHVQRSNQARIVVEMLQKHVIEFTTTKSGAQSSPSAPLEAAPSTVDPSTASLLAALPLAPSPSTAAPSTAGPSEAAPSVKAPLEVAPSAASPPAAPAATPNGMPTEMELDHSQSDGKNLLPESNQRPPSSPSTSDPSDLMLLPSLNRKNWVSLLPPLKRCFRGSACRFYHQRRCDYYHDVLAPLPDEQPFVDWTVSSKEQNLPSLPENQMQFLSRTVGADEVKLWTAAYIYRPSNEVIYVRKALLEFGRVSENGVVWFPSKDEALLSLRCTVSLYRQGLYNQVAATKEQNSDSHKPGYRQPSPRHLHHHNRRRPSTPSGRNHKRSPRR